MTREAIQVFNRHVSDYDGWFDRNRLAYFSELEAIRRMLPRFKAGVEIGAGTRRFAVPLGIGFGVEPALEMARVARRTGMQIVSGVAESLPFKSECFDLVLMVTAICFFDDVEAALCEARRILLPHGTLVIGFIDRESRLGKLYERRKSNSRFYKYSRFFSASEVEALLKKHKFNQIGFVQTILDDPQKLNEIDAVKKGYGQGGFVVARAIKGALG